MARPNKGSFKTKIRKDKNGKVTKFYQSVFRYTDENGKPQETAKTVENISEHRRWIRAQQDLINNNGVKAIRFQDITFLEFSREFEAANITPAKRTPDGKKYTGRKSYKPVLSQLKFLRGFFGKMKVVEIEHNDIVRYKNFRVEKPIILKNGTEKSRSPQTVKRELALLSKMFTTLKKQGKVTVSPFERGETILPSAEIESERLRVLSPEEETKLFAACDTVKGGKHRKHIKPLLTFAIETGMRRNEIRSLCWTDIDFDSNTITIKQQNTKTERPREVPINPARLLPLLLEMKKSTKSETDKIFGDLPNSFRKPFETACNIAKLEDLHFHDLRATFITRAIERGVSPEIVRRVSGHKQDKAFQRYLRFSKQSLNQAFFGEMK